MTPLLSPTPVRRYASISSWIVFSDGSGGHPSSGSSVGLVSTGGAVPFPGDEAGISVPEIIPLGVSEPIARILATRSSLSLRGTRQDALLALLWALEQRNPTPGCRASDCAEVLYPGPQGLVPSEAVFTLGALRKLSATDIHSRGRRV